MLRMAIFFFVMSLIFGGVGLIGLSLISRRIAYIFFVLFMLGALALLGFAYLLGEAFQAGRAMLPAITMIA